MNELTVATFEEVLGRVEGGKSRAGFGTYDLVPTTSKDKFGRVGIRQFFEEPDVDFEILTPEELNEHFESGNWVAGRADNTYNYGGYAERDMQFTVYENEETEEVIALYRVHVGLDIRAGYTDVFAVLYDSEYTFHEHLMERFSIGYASFKQDGVLVHVAIDAEVASEYVSVYIQTDDSDHIHDDETVELDTYDREDFKESLIDYLKENDIEYDKGTLSIE